MKGLDGGAIGDVVGRGWLPRVEALDLLLQPLLVCPNPGVVCCHLTVVVINDTLIVGGHLPVIVVDNALIVLVYSPDFPVVIVDCLPLLLLAAANLILKLRGSEAARHWTLLAYKREPG